MRSTYLLKYLLGGIFLFLVTTNLSRLIPQDVTSSGTSGWTITNQYYKTRTIQLKDGSELGETIIDGPPHPPPGYDLEYRAVTLPRTNQLLGIVTLNVPAYEWFFGCSATSGAMIAAYYDRNGFPNMYTGPTNGGVMPMDNSLWPSWTDGAGSVYAQCPLTASHLGLDDKTIRGSIDDYWIAYGSTSADPYINNGWSPHTWGDAIGDFMKTSQSAYGNSDGATTFYFNPFGGKLTCDTIASLGFTKDGTYGRKLFYEARGYIVTDCYSQNTDNNGGGYTFAMYKAEIDAGRPVMINLEGHTIVGIGYDDTDDTVYIHNTWDTGAHTMLWGGSYAGMAMQSVSIVNFRDDNPPTCYPLTLTHTGSGDDPTASPGNSVGCSSGQYLADQDISLTAFPDAGYHVASWSGTGDDESTANTNSLTMPASPRTVTANYAGNPPGPFTKSSPAYASTGISTSPTFSWDESDWAASYEYCYSISPDTPCTSWIGNSSSTSVALSGLNYSTTYYWQVRSINGFGISYANNDQTALWPFTTEGEQLPCYQLILNHTGPGSNPIAAPSHSSGCQEGYYNERGMIYLTAFPYPGNHVASWLGSNDDRSTSLINNLTMPAGTATVMVTYVPNKFMFLPFIKR